MSECNCYACKRSAILRAAFEGKFLKPEGLIKIEGNLHDLELSEVDVGKTFSRFAEAIREPVANAEPEPASSSKFPEPGYERLHAVFRDAHDQAAIGKGDERHANSLPFDEQRMQTISQGLGSPDGMAYQVIKKIQEGLQMNDHARTRAELLGALNYLAGIVIFLDDKQHAAEQQEAGHDLP